MEKLEELEELIPPAECKCGEFVSKIGEHSDGAETDVAETPKVP